MGYPLPLFLGFYCGSAGKESASSVGNLGFIPGLGRSPGEGKGYPVQYSGLENSMDCTVHGVAKSWIKLSDFHFSLKKKSAYKPIWGLSNLCCLRVNLTNCLMTCVTPNS